MKKIIFSLLIIFSVSFVIMIFSALTFSQRELPPGREGEDAEALTEKIERAVNMDAWKKSAAYSFTLPSGNRYHFVDQKRELAELVWFESDVTYLVQWDKKSGRYVVQKNGSTLTDQTREKYFQQAVGKHDEDIFWLNPFAALKLSNAVRKFVGAEALLVTYRATSSAKDKSYLIVVDENGMPTHWDIWAPEFPVAGFEISFEGWSTLSTGAKVSLIRKSSVKTLYLTDVKGYREYPSLEEKDRFALLFRDGR